ncbi:MAG: hypothetical protein LUC24_05375 [Bacteroidales bacterium]|nr:hypothetical protein [Bacteroidales bacterium]
MSDTTNLTAKQVQTDFIALLRGSSLEAAVSGSVYRDGYRPRDSRLEDIVVAFTTGTAAQVDSGVVTLNIFVPDIADSDGTLVEDGARTAELEAAAQTWFDGLSGGGAGDYLLSLRQTIYTEAEPETHEHFVSVRLGYRYFAN